jgi:hypothetical protein
MACSLITLLGTLITIKRYFWWDLKLCLDMLSKSLHVKTLAFLSPENHDSCQNSGSRTWNFR